jgi:hypothetical protein
VLNSLEEINVKLAALGYLPIGELELSAISRVVGQVWQQWLDDCLKLKQSSQHWDTLRSCLLAVSQPLNMVILCNCLDAPLDRRLAVLMANGKRLRSAIASYIKTKDARLKMQAYEVIERAFKPQKGPLPVQIEAKVHRVFAAKTAVVFEHAHTKEGRACLQIESASRESITQGFDWQKKIILQLNDSELMQLLAVLKNWQPQLEISNHGQALDKRLTFRKQAGGGYFISVRQGSIARAMPVPPFEAFRLISLALRVLLENEPHMNVDAIWSLCEQMAND